MFRDSSCSDSLYSLSFFFFLFSPRPPGSTLFPYTTLFRSVFGGWRGREIGVVPMTLISGSVNCAGDQRQDRKSTRLNSSHRCISYAVFCLKKKTMNIQSSIGNAQRRIPRNRSVELI